MKNIGLLGASLTSLAVVACASTSVVDTWRAPDYSGGKVSSIIVVGVSKKPEVRRTFEDEFSKRLAAKGVRAVQSYTLIPEEGQVTEARLREAVEKSGFDAVIVTRLAKVEKRSAPSAEYSPPYRYGSYYGFYTDAWSDFHEPQNQYQYDVFVLQTTLFRSDREKPVWSGTTETFAPDDVQKETAGFADKIIAAMSKDGMI
jgi:hypothetical protein